VAILSPGLPTIGTAGAIRMAKAKGIPVRIYQDKP
jgi:hypothetical protein